MLIILSPIFKPLVFFENRIHSAFYIFFENKRLVKYNAQLRHELGKAVNENRILRTTLDTLSSQTLMLSTYSSHDLKFVGAQTLYLTSNKYARSIIIDKGEKHNIKVNQPVVTDKGLVGIVKLVSRSSSAVQLIIDQNSYVGGKITDTNDRCIIYGVGNPEELHLQMEVMSPDIHVGDEVVTAGIKDSLYPPGLLIGEIINFNIDTRGNKYAIVRPGVSFQKISNVLVIVEKK